jgi:hypothetical protein
MDPQAPPESLRVCQPSSVNSPPVGRLPPQRVPSTLPLYATDLG